MEANQVHVPAAAMSCDSQQVIHAVEAGFTGEIVGDFRPINLHDRIDNDMAIVHRVTTADLYMRTRPDANAASDDPAEDSLSKALGERHRAQHTGWGRFGQPRRRRLSPSALANPTRRTRAGAHACPL